jgi:hypothetical protein
MAGVNTGHSAGERQNIMNPALAFAQPSLAQLGLRSLVTNAPFGITVVGVFAAIHTLVGWRSESEQRSTFLKALAASPAPNAVLMAYRDAKDPLDLAARHLEDHPDETTGPIRAALAATF